MTKKLDKTIHINKVQNLTDAEYQKIFTIIVCIILNNKIIHINKVQNLTDIDIKKKKSSTLLSSLSCVNFIFEKKFISEKAILVTKHDNLIFHTVFFPISDHSISNVLHQ